jgi:hypothetical protein
VRGRGSRAASSETENPLEGPGPLSEAETHPRGRQALERDGNLPEGVSSPRARWGFHGAAPGPRARRSFARGIPGPAACWAVGPSLPWVATTRGIICDLWIRLFAFYYFRKGRFPPLLGDPYGCPRHSHIAAYS